MGRPNIDLTGRTFGILTCIQKLGKDEKGRQQYLCRCACGIEKIILHSNLNSNKKSCGCHQRSLLAERNKTHGNFYKPYYRIWYTIKTRCHSPRSSGYKNYGARGIFLYSLWLDNFEAFKNYILSTLGPQPNKMYTLDRIDNSKGYEPGNLRWATPSLQCFNRRIFKSKSGLRNIDFKHGKFRANITKDYIRYHLGSFATKEEAIKAVNDMALKLYGELPPDYR